ncbi:Protein of unknown function [Ruminococcus sp. YE71]|uniref:DUF2975 domain-containing protein n=1 Tax=unclassified Ruminococcus TaxID=2608920 RepID=UPI000886A616|nr:MULTISPECIES: DUF2975 domain-containing protein [unclassified Ruminococcus]SDA09901.1 Protein of unknown function [Ruminococcus sp. YE78]SFW11251.1 Protein of unknown function [Ruminococcus sp. YE71]
MWNPTRSLKLSRILVTTFSVLIFMLTFFVPFFAQWYDEASQGMGLIGGSIVVPTIITLYICEGFAVWALVSLHILLRNIDRGEIFIVQNTSCLRSISWACMLAGCAFAMMGLWRYLFALPAFAAVMLGLIMRVLKNVFEQAVEIKSENDFTI